jgi:hypothetical protein
MVGSMTIAGWIIDVALIHRAGVSNRIPVLHRRLGKTSALLQATVALFTTTRADMAYDELCELAVDEHPDVIVAENGCGGPGAADRCRARRAPAVGGMIPGCRLPASGHTVREPNRGAARGCLTTARRQSAACETAR